MLTADHLTFRYSQSELTYNFSFSARPGEILAVSGVSGAGKSTLLDLVAGFQMPSAGSLVLDEQDLTGLPADQRPVSILFQSDNLFDHLSVKANLALAGTAGPGAQDAIRNAMKAVGLQDFAGQKAASLSGGQKQRVALARTLMLDRPVLLLDEPFSALDADTAADMRALVRQSVLTRKWHTILVSHQSADLAIADRHLTLSGGSLATR